MHAVEGNAAPGKVALLISPNFTDSSNGHNGFGTSSDEGNGQSLSVAVVDPDFERRSVVSSIVHALRSNGRVPRVTPLTDVGNTQILLNQGFDIVLIAVDQNKETSLKTIEILCRAGTATPMAYSARTDDDLLIRCMRAGVREFLLYPFATGVLEEAFGRSASRVQLIPDSRKAVGKSFVFLGAKGGSGVTTAACNFAVA